MNFDSSYSPHRCPQCHHLPAICSHEPEPNQTPVFERKTLERNVKAIYQSKIDRVKSRLADLSRFPLKD